MGIAVPKTRDDVTPSAGGGISWGMGEDAVDEDEAETEHPDMAKNPFAGAASFAGPTPHENSFSQDPKRALRNWFEREGAELEYNCVEKGYATFTCTVRLPIENLEAGGGGVLLTGGPVRNPHADRQRGLIADVPKPSDDGGGLGEAEADHLLRFGARRAFMAVMRQRGIERAVDGRAAIHQGPVAIENGELVHLRRPPGLPPPGFPPR